MAAYTQARSLKKRGLASRALSAEQMDGIVQKFNDPKRRIYTAEEMQNWAWMDEQEFKKKQTAHTKAISRPCKLNFT